MSKLLMLVLVFQLCGCSSIVARSNGEFGHPFSGPAQSILFQPCGFMASAALWFAPYPLVLADIPISFAADLLLLPVDIAMMPSDEPAYSNIKYHPPSTCMFGG